MIEIGSRAEYDLCVDSGFNPLIDWRKFHIEINLRIAIQKELFGAPSFQLENQKFYKWCWDHKIKNCEETGRPLHYFAAVHVSHILGKGSDRRMATDVRNCNLLIYRVHNIWDFGTEKQKQKLNIYRINQLVIQMLKNDYNKL